MCLWIPTKMGVQYSQTERTPYGPRLVKKTSIGYTGSSIRSSTEKYIRHSSHHPRVISAVPHWAEHDNGRGRHSKGLLGYTHEREVVYPPQRQILQIEAPPAPIRSQSPYIIDAVPVEQPIHHEYYHHHQHHQHNGYQNQPSSIQVSHGPAVPLSEALSYRQNAAYAPSGAGYTNARYQRREGSEYSSSEDDESSVGYGGRYETRYQERRQSAHYEQPRAAMPAGIMRNKSTTQQRPISGVRYGVGPVR
ncbi:hypothetical protein FPQ18DRAFT_334740 [Pyronema domesticum]|nr:hypothetical protein FPQ18DRAFT_334740 [Pyronema domesticum]